MMTVVTVKTWKPTVAAAKPFKGRTFSKHFVQSLN